MSRLLLKFFLSFLLFSGFNNLYAQDNKNSVISKENLFANARSYIENNYVIGLRNDAPGLADSLSYYKVKIDQLSLSPKEKSQYGSVITALEFYYQFRVENQFTEETYSIGKRYFDQNHRNDLLSYKVRLGMLPLGMRLHIGKKNDYLLQLFDNAIKYQNSHRVASKDAAYAYYNQGYYFYELQKFDESLECFEKINDATYEATKISFKLLYYFTIKEYSRGLLYYENNIDNPNLTEEDLFEIKSQLSHSLIMIQDHETAVELFETDLGYRYDQETMNTVALKYRISSAYLGLQEYQKAQALLEYIVENKKVKDFFPQVYEYSLMNLLNVYTQTANLKDFERFNEEANRLIEFYDASSIVGVKIRMLKAEHLYLKEEFDEAYEMIKNLEPQFDVIRNGNAFKEVGYALLSKIALSLSKQEESDFYKNAYQELVKANYESEKSKSEVSKEILSSNYRRKIAKQEADIANINLKLEKTRKKRDITIIIVVSIVAVLSIIIIIVLFGRRKLQLAFSEVKKEKLSVDILLGEREKLLAYVSHQSKVPMVNMKYMLDMIENVRDMSEEEVEFITQSVKYSLNNVDAQMKDILNWSKLVLNKYIEISKENLHAIIQELIEENRFLAAQKNISILNSISGDIFVNTNKLALKTIISNLLVNAIKYSDKNSKVFVGFDGNSISIQDSAKALSDEKKEILLARQKTVTVASNQKKQMFTSSGLGLFIAKDLCEKLNYQIDIQNTKNNTFLVILSSAN